MPGIKDNMQHILGKLIGYTLRGSAFRFSKAQRGTLAFSTVAANLTADGISTPWLPYAI